MVSLIFQNMLDSVIFTKTSTNLFDILIIIYEIVLREIMLKSHSFQSQKKDTKNNFLHSI